MRPCATPPLIVRGAAFGGPRPLICVPLVGRNAGELRAQAEVAREAAPDVIEWRADFYEDRSIESMTTAAARLRDVVADVPVIYTLRIKEEGGAVAIPNDARRQIIGAVVETGLVDLVDVELCNGSDFIGPLVDETHRYGVRVILSAHDFERTPSLDVLVDTVARMVRERADVAKVACMPGDPGDVLRLLQATSLARTLFPDVPLCTMSMGSLGLTTRVAGCLFGSDMSFAVGQAASAPGQIPIAELRTLIDGLLRHA